MNKVKILEVKKLLKELEFIESDFEYRNEIIFEADSIFINSINNFLENHEELKKIYDNKITEKINQSIKKSEKSDEEIITIEDDTIDTQDESEYTSQNEENIEDKESISIIKKLYREIVKLTHPDKAKNKNLNDIYLKATKFYDESNKIGIYSICDELNINYDIEEDDIVLISNEIKKIQEKISFIESTYTWQWYNCKDEVLKNQILINYIKLKIR